MRLLLLTISIAALYACGGPQPTENVAEEPVLHYYGDSISADGAVQPLEMLAMMSGKDSIETKITATINQTCRTKGCWMTLDMGNDEQMRVRFKDYGFFVPTEGADGKTAIIEGYAFVDTISVEHLRHLAEDAGKSEEEIAAINTPEVSVNFEARGVIIKD